MNEFVILLTCCVNPLYCSKRECKKRKELFLKVIEKWLNETSFEIYCVDSSNYKFPEIDNSRFHLCSFLYKNKDPNIGKTNEEVKSILKAYKQIKKEWKPFTHFIKITGRYYLEDLERWTKTKLKSKNDLWTQQDCLPFLCSVVAYFLSQTNSEIFIFRISKIYESFSNKNKNILMERHLFSMEESYKYAKLPRLKNTLKSRRGGDNLLIKYL
jgi:hypothetical protein